MGAPVVTAADGDVRCCQLEIASWGLGCISSHRYWEYVSKVASGSGNSRLRTLQGRCFRGFGIERGGF